jgi:hypothetical protein
MLFLPFQNVVSVHQIAPNRMQVFKKISGGQTPGPLQLGALPPDPREGKRREGKGKERGPNIGLNTPSFHLKRILQI